MKQIILLLSALLLMLSCSSECKDEACQKPGSKNVLSAPAITAQNSDSTVKCKLTSEELNKRKETILASLKKQILEKKELDNGYAFKFSGADATVDELTEFVKSERSCCNFFVFTLSFSGDGKETWLSLTGPEGAKDMIKTELGL